MRVREKVGSELRAAWRGIRARRWRAPLIVGLLAVSLGAAVVVFSAADSFVFGRVPYPNTDRLIVLQRTSAFGGTNDYLPPEIVAEWRKHTDLFTAVHAHDRGPSMYLTVGDLTESVRSQLVTPGLFEALGTVPRWGRPLQPGDESPDRDPVAVIAEELLDALYERLFGDVRLAVSVTSALGSLAFIVASAGVYGVMAFLVSGRTREIGVRMALGAAPADIRRMFLLSSARTLVAGALLGIAGAAMMARTIESMLFGVSATDATALLGMAAALGTAVVAASVPPAARAARTNPLDALRHE